MFAGSCWNFPTSIQQKLFVNFFVKNAARIREAQDIESLGQIIVFGENFILAKYVNFSKSVCAKWIEFQQLYMEFYANR